MVLGLNGVMKKYARLKLVIEMTRMICGECGETLCKELTTHDGCGKCHNENCSLFVPLGPLCGI